MELNDHERREFQRAAKALYARGANAEGHALSVCAAERDVPVTQYDRAATIYRAWLVFDEPKVSA